MTKTEISHDQLLATYWLHNDDFPESSASPRERLRAFVDAHDLLVPDAELEQVATKLDGKLVGGDPDDWVTMQCVFGHPYTVWNFIIDAVAAAETADHLAKIAAGPAEHLLAYYGSLIPLFEKQAKADENFGRMLTGVWRHKMCDDVWRRLRAIQLAQPGGLDGKSFEVLDEDWMSETLSEEDRMTPDKGRFRRTKDGHWEAR